MPSPSDSPRLQAALRRARRAVARVRLTVGTEMQYQALLDNLHEGVLFMDAEGNLLQVNPAAERILGMGALELRARLAQGLEGSGLIREDGSPFRTEDAPSRRALSTGQPCLDVVVGHPDGPSGPQWISVNAVPLHGPDGRLTGVVSSLVDITPLKQLQARLQAEATQDVLTGLANRRCYLENLTKAYHGARRHGHGLSAAFCDLDHLKALNDSHGHAAGDLAIQAFGRLVAGALRREDLAARFGGDEFCVLFSHVNAAEARVCLERVLTQVRGLALELPDGTHLGGFTASMGLASLTPAHTHPDELLEAADQALYRAKEAGRDRLVVA